jgi:hypothetical protein
LISITATPKNRKKKLQPKRTHLLCNTQKPTNLNNNNWEWRSSVKLNYSQKYLLLLTQYNNQNCKKHTQVLINSR